ncbi:hypothetical protein F5Y16DRAFT_404990 [Xylariaceae sp. FL0255]|nr:hypothetical protein F5Y16DRAFT_404990 [Xylariaceae sp. FL0255]
MRFTPGRIGNFPSSPWAEQFPFADLSYVKDATNHSILAPFYPRSDNETDTNGPRDDQELDRLLLLEEWQIEKLRGIRTWETAALNNILYFSKGTGYVWSRHLAHLGMGTANSTPWTWDSYNQDKIRVNETTWLPFFRRDRWFDFTSDDPNERRQTWSIDDPQLRTFIWGRIEDWDAVKGDFGTPRLPKDIEEPTWQRILIDYANEQWIAAQKGLSTVVLSNSQYRDTS